MFCNTFMQDLNIICKLPIHQKVMFENNIKMTLTL